MNYSNPRTEATIENWPSGSKRVTAKFYVEHNPARGERTCRQTTGAPVKLPFANRQRIVDGDDGRTYILCLSRAYGFVNVMKGDMKYHHETIHHDDPRYPEIAALLGE